MTRTSLERTWAAQVCRAFDVPEWLVLGGGRPRLFRLRWALRRLTGYTGR